MSVVSNEWRNATRGGQRWRLNSEKLILALMVLLIGLLSVAPLLRLVWTAIAPQGVPDMARLTRLVASDRVLIASGNTLLIAFSSTLISVLLGAAAAWLVALSDLRAKTAWVFAFILPLMIPPQVTALAWLQALAPSSPLALLFGSLGLPWFAPGEQPLYSLSGIVLLLGTHNAPLVFLTVRAGLRRLPADLVEAAQISGASRMRVLFTIILPLARPAIFAGAALTFVAAAGNFGIQAMLGIPARVPTLITLVYQQLNGIGPSALPNTAVYALLLPVSALLITALTSGYGQALTWQTLTLENFRSALWGYPAVRHAFMTSLGLTTLAAMILTSTALFLAYFLSWRRTKLVLGLWLASELTYALPGIVTGVAAMLFFLRPLPIINVSLYGTVWIILAAYLANFLALVLRPTLAGFAQLEPALDEAARLCGASFMRRMRDILLPLAAPSALAGTVLVFLTALNEIQVSVLLVTSQTQTIGPTIVFLDEGGSASLAAAVGCLMILVVCLLMGLATRLARRLPQGVLPWQA